MSFTKLALKRPVSCALIILALIIFGITSIFGFRMELTPDMELPLLLVTTVYPGADPESIDELVSEVIEDAGSTLSGIKSVSSSSSENMSLVLFQFEYGADIDDCYTDLRAALDASSRDLPTDAQSPVIIEMNMNAVPIMEVSATETGDIDMLSVINNDILPDLKTLSSVAKIDVTGGTNDYIRVQLRPDALRQYGLTMSSITSIISTADFTYPAGSIPQGSQNINVSTSIDYNTVQLLRTLPLATQKGATITMEDVAYVSMASTKADSISRLNGDDNISISFTKNQSSGTVNTCRDIEKGRSAQKRISLDPVRHNLRC